jgi:ABC-type multidrug transport system ATPase subunit
MIISISGLTLIINNNEIFKNIEFNFNSGEITNIKGENGSGKTSLLNCILGIYNDYAGSVEMNRELIDVSNQLKYNRKISFLIVQNMYYPSLTVEENINIFKYYYQVQNLNLRITQLFSEFGLENFKNIKASKLSEGYKKKLSIILSIINNGDSVIMDEPFNFLDQNSVDYLIQYFIYCTSQNKSVIFSAHQQNIFESMRFNTLTL